MARNDAFLLSVPDPAPRAPLPEAEPAGPEPMAAQPDPPAVEAAPDPAPATELKRRLAELSACPHCKVRLSAIDQKLNRCFGCGRTLIVPEAPEAVTGKFTVRI